MPLIVRFPGVTTAGTACDEPVCTIDFYPTLLAALKLTGDAAHNRHVDGVSLLPLLLDPAARLAREALYFHYPHYYATTSPVSAIRLGRWKLLEYFETDAVELYDLEADLGESNDLAAKLPDRAADLRTRLHAWRESINARVPTINPNFVEPP